MEKLLADSTKLRKGMIFWLSYWTGSIKEDSVTELTIPAPHSVVHLLGGEQWEWEQSAKAEDRLHWRQSITRTNAQEYYHN